MHGRAECIACVGDGELAPTSESLYAWANDNNLSGLEMRALLPYGHRAWCVACHGTGLADIECEGCGEPVAADAINEDALANVDVLVHPTCDTGHAFFDTHPAKAAAGWR